MLHTFITIQFIMFTIAANAFIYRLQHIPVIGKRIKSHWYAKKSLKGILGAFAVIESIFFQFLRKIVYVAVMLVLPVFGINNALADKTYTAGQMEASFLYLFFLLSLIYGAFFRVTCMNAEEKDYIMLKQMHINPRTYYIGNMFVKIIGETIVFAIALVIPWMEFAEERALFMLPALLMLAMFRFVGEATALFIFKKYNTNYLNMDSKVFLTVTILILPAAYGTCILFGDAAVVATIFYSPITWAASAVAGILSIRYILKYKEYRSIANKVVKLENIQMEEESKKNTEEESIGILDEDIKHEDIHTTKYDGLKGYEYLHAIFFDRHKRLVRRKWKLKMLFVGACAIIGAVLSFVFRNTEVAANAAESMDKLMPIWLFALYFSCSGEKLCKALFYHCDISLLKYGYYRDSKTMLDNFRIRLRYLVKLDLQPALLLCAGIALSMICMGRPYRVITLIPLYITILLASIFFDIYQLFLYYVFQPYLENYETKSMGYTICSTLMYWTCYGSLQIKSASFTFTIIVAVITIICIPLSYLLIYKLAPKRFKLH